MNVPNDLGIKKTHFGFYFRIDSSQWILAKGLRQDENRLFCVVDSSWEAAVKTQIFGVHEWNS